MDRQHILKEATRIICGEREGQYGSPENNFGIIANLWSLYLGKPITETDICNMMILLKVARSKSGTYKEDNWIDICGYAAIGGELGGLVTNEVE